MQAVIENQEVIIYNFKTFTYKIGTIIRVNKTQFRVQPQQTDSARDQMVFSLDRTPMIGGRFHYRMKSRWGNSFALPHTEENVKAVEELIRDGLERESAANAKRKAAQDEAERVKAEAISKLKATVDLITATRLLDTVGDDITYRVIDLHHEGRHLRVTITVQPYPEDELEFRGGNTHKGVAVVHDLSRSLGAYHEPSAEGGSESEVIWELIYQVTR